MAKKHLQHIKSSQKGKIPTPQDLMYGEIAVNYAEDSEQLFIKNSEDEIVPFVSAKEIEKNELAVAGALAQLDEGINDLRQVVKDDEFVTAAAINQEEIERKEDDERIRSIIEDNEHVTAEAFVYIDSKLKTVEHILQQERVEEITQQKLISKIESRILVPGVYYRIVDYPNPSLNDEFSGYETHQFDIIALALDNRQLSKQAYATYNTTGNDNYFYFSDLQKWELEVETGRQAIYVTYMKDECGNEACFDFKNYRHQVVFSENFGDSVYLSSKFFDENGEVKYDPEVANSAGYAQLVSNRDLYTMPFLVETTDRLTSISELRYKTNVAPAYGNNHGEFIVPGGPGYCLYSEDGNFIVKFSDGSLNIKYVYTFSQIDDNTGEIRDASMSGVAQNNKVLSRQSCFFVGSTELYADCVNNVIETGCSNVYLSLSTNNAHILNNVRGCKISDTDQCTVNYMADSINIGGCNAVTIGNNTKSVSCIASNMVDIGTFSENIAVLNSNGLDIGKRCESIILQSNNTKIGSESSGIIFTGSTNNITVGSNCSGITMSLREARNIIIGQDNHNIELTTQAEAPVGGYIQNITITQSTNIGDDKLTISHNTLDDDFRTIYQGRDTVIKSIELSTEPEQEETDDIYEKMSLTFIPLSSSSTFKFTRELYYSTDNEKTWTVLPANTNTPSIANGNRIAFKGNLTQNGTFTATGSFNVEGNVMSLVGYADTLNVTNIFGLLFNNNTYITSAKNMRLPATTLSNSCYNSMFKGCSALTAAPELPATTLAPNCYQSMFEGCTHLTTTPELPATTLANYCYSHMFKGCTALTTVSSFGNVLVTPSYCYQYMFQNCTSLVTLGAFPSFKVAGSYCCQYMFQGCTKLTTAPELTATGLGYCCYQYMFDGCTKLTAAPALPATTLASYCYQYMFQNCTSLTTAPTILPATTLNYGCCSHMFDGCTKLTAAPELPATSLAGTCYEYMFQRCTSLTTPPALPATTMSLEGYKYMFNGCTSLTTAPELPATYAPSFCYAYMFSGCTSLTATPTTLPATSMQNSCYSHMFDGCTSLTTAPATLPATSMQNSCYTCMFKGCTNLTTAPELPATTLANGCYSYMFQNCSKLNYIKAMFTTTPSTSYTSNWVSGVAATGTFVKNSTATWTTTGVHAVPSGWTVETASA